MLLRKIDQKFLLVFCSGVVKPTSSSFKANPFRYLLKSYPTSELISEMTEIINEMKIRKNSPYIMCKCGSGKEQIRVYPESILYIAIRHHSSEIFAYGKLKKCFPDEVLRVDMNLNSVWKIFNESCGFVRAHNSYMINMAYIIFASPHSVRLIDGTELTVSRSRSKEFQQAFAKYMKTAAVLCTAGCVYLVNSLDSSIINIVGMQIIYITMIIAVFQESFFRKIPYYLMATAIMAGSEFLCIIFLSHPSNFSLSQVTTNVASMIFFLLCTKLISFILFNIVKGILGRSNNRMSRKNLLLYSVVPIATLGIMISLAYLNIDWDQIGFVIFVMFKKEAGHLTTYEERAYYILLIEVAIHVLTGIGITKWYKEI